MLPDVSGGQAVDEDLSVVGERQCLARRRAADGPRSARLVVPVDGDCAADLGHPVALQHDRAEAFLERSRDRGR